MTERWNPISAAIRFETRSWASHAEFVDTDKQITLGARSGGGVQFRDCKHDHYSRVEQFTAANIRHAWDWACGEVGKKYDYSAIAGIAFNRDWRNEDRFFCSEFIALSFEKVGWPLLSTRPSVGIYRITPRDLLLSRELIYVGGYADRVTPRDLLLSPGATSA